MYGTEPVRASAWGVLLGGMASRLSAQTKVDNGSHDEKCRGNAIPNSAELVKAYSWKEAVERLQLANLLVIYLGEKKANASEDVAIRAQATALSFIMTPNVRNDAH